MATSAAWFPMVNTGLFPTIGTILRATIPEESVMVRTAQAAEVSSTTSMPGPCSGPQTTPAILEYQPAEKIRECACIISKIAKCALIVLYCAHIVTYV